MNITLEQILEQSPNIEGYGGGKWAMYSTSCCWWTSFPEDLGKMPPMKYIKGSLISNPGGHSLPCCPHCKSVLMQAPLEKFVAFAKQSAEHYGKNGIDNFTAAHSRNSKTCEQSWDAYSKEGA